MRFGLWFSILLFLFNNKKIFCHDLYDENLDINWLPNGDYLLTFNFNFSFSSKESSAKRGGLLFDRFPKMIYDVMHRHSMNEFHLSLTQGMWRYKQFGYPVSFTPNPSGAELWIWFGDKVSLAELNSEWDLAVNSLAGFFCASLNFMSTSFSGSPARVLKPLSRYHSNLNSSSMKYANLPAEIVCTENLTPWKKLLPCEVSSGIVQLLNPNQVFSSKYTSLDVSAFVECLYNDCENRQIVLKMTAAVVFDGYKYPDYSRTFSLLTLLHKPLGVPCPVAGKTSIAARSSKAGCSLILSTRGNLETSNKLSITTNDWHTDINLLRKCEDQENETEVKAQEEESEKKTFHSPVLVQKYLSTSTGFNEEFIICQITNRIGKDVKIGYFDLVPWHFRLLTHTLTILTSNGSNIQPTFFSYVPSIDRERSSTFEMELVLPAQESIEITMKIRKVLLKWTEHPPDPHHGHNYGPSIVYVDLDGFTHRVYSEPLIIQLMVPDFSMPYNVLCLSCTIMTIGYSAAQTLVTKRYMFVARKNHAMSMKAKLKSIKTKIMSLFKRAKTEETATAKDQ